MVEEGFKKSTYASFFTFMIGNKARTSVKDKHKTEKILLAANGSISNSKQLH